MALDGIYLYSLINDLKNSIVNSKIDKINQPEKDEIILTLRKDRKNLKLLISASSRFARIHLTNTVKENPIKAPMYLMVLRKYILGGRITNLIQKDSDRIIIMEIENRDELGFDSIYSLIIEIMGRHSNITLVRNRDNKVMESIKHITADINSYRVLYPGVNFVYPPSSNKLNPFSTTYEELNSYVVNNSIPFDDNFYSNCFTGISKLLSKDLYYNLIKSNTTPATNEIYEDFKNFIDNLDNNISYNIYSNSLGIVKDFYSLKLNSLGSDFLLKSYDDPNTLMEDFFVSKDKQDRLQNKSTDLQKLIHTNIERCNKKSKILNETLIECSEKESLKIKGDLLTSYIYTIKKGDEECTLLNFYNEEEEEYMKIALDKTKTPSENVQRYYKKYNKLKTSEEYAKAQLEKNLQEIAYLNSVLTNILNAESYSEIDEIKNELVETGYIRFRKNNKNAKQAKTSKPHHFVSSDGIDIYVGKNNLQNDYLSLKFANKNHLWLHAKDIPGSHVIVCAFDVPDSTLEEAAIIAGYYSKGKDSAKLPIDYTKVKELKKPNGAKPGMVIYHTNWTLFINPSDFNNKFKV
ncbi:putative ribosome quality control (RQC) complex YloA/Tae2 family protein [Clostridium saccharoperbutylacetonicum]|uniref:Rqc2 homolog RqcH n=1 Tax=Clostridium saccharoperbutylacetonicum N1-4(HMT) TaxID=931276 RepID=M1LTQ0_9CLOT|nr:MULTISPECIES: NFACT RNA binding domain-containing protein [Clostridium]AGF56410.1 putative RNA-binding protein, snRNP like protein [Clostridium saccharoperbutylacetonicum N1-4(HMT)]NRT62846.1 putative ribosome quality control (RQC) complex YloA/Tae2 family protein [Clostridium saccharoperbutylacetonicum]NSB26201.1 putative ribosome quality control (RQC) complex YloA/Tae2 family protein [Clostridium saccharoperbutylacetonicum]NSB45554.1 putative ribosome quality control (RQC) complex YloA/Tae